MPAIAQEFSAMEQALLLAQLRILRRLEAERALVR
jgi:hypothetical protein